jgi:accessory colonization factor AcfA
MYKRIAAASLLLASTVASAEVYVGVGYQAGSSRVEKNALRNPVVDGRALDLSRSESSAGLRLLAGMTLSDNWAVELAAQRSEVDDSFDQPVSLTQDEDWEASIRSTHITLAPVYIHSLSEKVDLRATAGLLYGDYDIRQSHAYDNDDAPDELISRNAASKSKLGGMVGIGAAYHTPWKFDLIGEVQHQRTGYVSNSSVSVTAAYRF